MSERIRQWQRASPAVVFVTILALYALGGVVAWGTIRTTGLGAVFFAPAGVTFAAAVALRRRTWPALVAAIVAGEYLVGLTIGEMDDLTALAGFAAANVIEPIVGALLVSRLLHRPLGEPVLPDLNRRRDLAAFILSAVAVAPLFGASIGAATAWWRFDSDVRSLAPQLWLGDALGVIVVAPLILAWSATINTRAWRGPLGVVLVIGAALTTAGVLATNDMPLLFFALAIPVLAGALVGVRSVALTLATISAVAGVSLGLDPSGLVGDMEPSTALTIEELEFFVFALLALVVAAESNERLGAVRLATERRATVAELQRLLLPPTRMRGDGFVADGRYRAAATKVGVGGDWYLIKPALDGRVVIGVGDIVGHDADAARAMIGVRSGLVLEAAIDPTPHLLLDRLDLFADAEPAIRFGTAWIGVYDPALGTLEYACAGHLPPLLVTDTSVIRLDEANTALVGLAQGERYSARVDVAAGSALVLCTDGLIERRTEDLTDGLARLERAASGGDLDPDELLDEMLVDSPRDDDTILVVVRLDGTSSSAEHELVDSATADD